MSKKDFIEVKDKGFVDYKKMEAAMRKTISCLFLVFLCAGIGYLGNMFAEDSERYIFDDSIDESTNTYCYFDEKDPYGGALVRDQLNRQRHAREAYDRKISREDFDRGCRDRGNRLISYYNRHQIKLVDKTLHQPDENTAIINQAIFVNLSGDVIVDARFLKNLIMKSDSSTCTVCHRKINLNKIYQHYKRTKHRFFIMKGVVSKK